MTHESPESTISGKIGNVLRRPLASFMGVVALFASGCGLSGLDAKPAPSDCYRDHDEQASANDRDATGDANRTRH